MHDTHWLRLAAVAAALACLGACANEVSPAQPEIDVAVKAEALAPRITDCESSDWNRVRAMLENASSYISDARRDLANVQAGGSTRRFDYWFGRHDPADVSKVADVFASMTDWLSTVEFQCGCRPDDLPGTIAGATKGDPSQPVYFCTPALTWDLEEYGVGSVIHELSHLAGTEDLYSCARSGSHDWPEDFHSIATTAPDGALDNAEHFRLYGLDWHANRPSTRACP